VSILRGIFYFLVNDTPHFMATIITSLHYLPEQTLKYTDTKAQKIFSQKIIIKKYIKNSSKYWFFFWVFSSVLPSLFLYKEWMGRERKKQWKWRWTMRDWFLCGVIYRVLCRKGRRFRLRLLSGRRCMRGRMFVVAVAVSPWPFLVTFLCLFSFILFLCGVERLDLGMGMWLTYLGYYLVGKNRELWIFLLHLIFVLFGCWENVGKGKKVRLFYCLF